LAKFTPKLNPTDAELLALYNRDATKFALPAQVHLSYARFSAPASTAVPTAAELKDFVAADPKDFPDAKPDSLDAKTTAAATAAWQKAQSAQEAGLLAQNFVKALYDNGITRGTPAFDTLMQKAGVTISPLPAVVADQPVAADSPLPNEILQQAAQSLNAQRYYSDPVRLPDGAAVIFYEGATPASTPTFAQARDAVLAAYTDIEKAKQFEAHGKELQQQLVKAVAGGQSFKDAATALGLTVKNFAAVNFTDPPADLSYPVLAALAQPDAAGVPLILTLKPGAISPLLPTDDGATLVNLVQRNTPKLAPDSPDTLKSMKAMQVQEGELSADTIIAPIISKAMRSLQSNG
jgi:hypothetical protein